MFLRDFPSMGIPDALHNPRSDAYVRRKEENSFRRLLNLFNRACNATGRPRYEDVCPTLPLCAPDASAPVATRGDSAPTADTDGEGLGRPPPGESFVLPAMRDMRTDGFGPRLADRLSKYRFSARQRLEVLTQQEPHNSPPGFSLADDLEEAVHASVWKRWRLHDRHDDMAQWEDIKSSYSQLVSGVMSTANGDRRWLMRTTGCSEAVADAVVAQALDESVRRRGFVAPSGVR